MSFLTSKPQDQETRGLKKELNKKIEQYPQVQRIYINIIRSIHSSFNVYILHIYIYTYKCTLNTHKYLRIVRFNGIFFVVIQKTREMEGREYQWLLLVVDPKSHPPHEAKVTSFRVTPGGFVPQKTMGPTGEDLGHRRWGHIGTNIWKCREKNHFSDL